MFKITVNTEDLLGECPVWCDRSMRLFWTNILCDELFAHTPETGVTQRWPLPERLASFALTSDENRLLLGLESRLVFFDLSTAALTEIAKVPQPAATRVNDGRCDRQGNFVFGTMHEGEPREKFGAFYRLNANNLTIEKLSLPAVSISNSICFSPDGATLYYCDSPEKTIRHCDYPSLANDRVFATLATEGVPDGSCIDAQGYLWNAEWGAARIVRYKPDGSVDQVIATPARQPTCPVLAGPLFDTLYCTSARLDLSTPSEADGAVLAANFSFLRGLPESRFAG